MSQSSTYLFNINIVHECTQKERKKGKKIKKTNYYTMSQSQNLPYHYLT